MGWWEVVCGYKKSRERLIESAEILRSIAQKSCYSGLPFGHGPRGLIIIDQSLIGIVENLNAAVEALQTRRGMDGNPIAPAQVAMGLARMKGDTWAAPQFRAYMEEHLSKGDLQDLSRAFEIIGTVIGAIQ